jgi:hypothetical protein
VMIVAEFRGFGPFHKSNVKSLRVRPRFRRLSPGQKSER